MFRTIFHNIKNFIEAVGFNSGGNGSTWIRDKKKLPTTARQGLTL